jgi:hypothetical protein
MADANTWTRCDDEGSFRAAFADRELCGDGATFVIHSDGSLTGTAEGARLSGEWCWRDGFFCRRATLAGEDLGWDCEIIERSGKRMRYTRDMGRGTASIATLRSP